MKKAFIIITAGIGLIACTGNDKKAADQRDKFIKDSIAAEKNDKTLKDSVDFTTIQWLDSTYHDMGKVKEGKVVEVSFRFKNTGDKPLIITNVSASCGCTIPEKPEEPFAPGQEGIIKAKFDSKGRPVGEARKEVYVTGNIKPENSQVLTFRVEITD